MCLYTEEDMQNVGEPEFEEFVWPAAQIGRQLAMIGDDINARYETQFNHVIRSLLINSDTAKGTFAGVARTLFHDRQRNSNRVITPLCFGYRMAVTVVQGGVRGFFSNIIGFVVKFIITEEIAKWIAEQGGWRAALRYIPETVGWPTLGAIAGVCVLSAFASRLFSRRW